MLVKLGLIIVVSVLLLNLLFYWQQPAMVFYPLREVPLTPSSWRLTYEDVNFVTTDGERLHGWFISQPAARKTVLFFHGNAGNIAHRGESIRVFHALGLNVFIFDYRGYGKSSGRPSEEGLYTDARAAWSYLTDARKIPAQDIVLFGRSLGGVVAADLAAEVAAMGLIVESTFSSARDMANRVLPGISRLLYLRYGFDVSRSIKRVAIPVLVIHSPQDDIVPYRLGEKIFDAANWPKYFYKLRGDHNSGFLQSEPEYSQRLARFVTKDTLVRR